MAVPRGDLLAQHDQQVVARLGGPMGVCRMGVVLRAVDEVQARRPGEGRDLGRGAAAVGVPGVQMAVAPVPGTAPPLRAIGRVGRLDDGALLAVGERDGDLVRQPLRRHRVGAERDVPGARAHPSREVSRRRVVGAEEELGAGPSRPAPEALPAQLRPPLVEDADVEGVAGRARRDGRAVVGVGDLDLPHAGRDFDRHVHEVGGPGGQGAPDRPGLLVTVGGRGEGHASQRKRGGGPRHEECASSDAVMELVVVTHASTLPDVRELPWKDRGIETAEEFDQRCRPVGMDS